MTPKVKSLSESIVTGASITNEQQASTLSIRSDTENKQGSLLQERMKQWKNETMESTRRVRILTKSLNSCDANIALQAICKIRSIASPEVQARVFDQNSIEIDDNGRVVELRFKRNRILWSLPPELFLGNHLSHLQALSFYGCTRLQWIPPEIGKLSNLRELDLRGCKLFRLPTELSALTKLEILDLSFTKFLKGIPREEKIIHWMRNLRKLSMTRCSWLNVKLLLLQGIRQSDSLQYLNINFNNIKPKDIEDLLDSLPMHFPSLMVLNACPDCRSMSSQEYSETIAPRIAQLEDQNTVKYLLSANKKDGMKPKTNPLSLWPLIFEKMNKRHSDQPHRAMNVIYPLLRNGPSLASREAFGSLL